MEAYLQHITMLPIKISLKKNMEDKLRQQIYNASHITQKYNETATNYIRLLLTDPKLKRNLSFNQTYFPTQNNLNSQHIGYNIPSHYPSRHNCNNE